MTTIDERLQQLEHREAIRDLIANYCHGVDKHDMQLYLSLWEKEARFDIGEPFGSFTGIQEIENGLRGVWEGLPESHHFTTNLVMSISGDSGEALSDVDVTGTDAAGRAIVIAGTYADKVSLGEDGWKFRVRELKIHYWVPINDPWSLDPTSRFKL